MSTQEERKARRNGDLLREVAAVIRSFPENYDQTLYGYNGAHRETIVFADRTEREVTCGTAHCIAGWAAVLSGYKPTKVRGGGFDWDSMHRGRSPKDEMVYDVGSEQLGLIDGFNEDKDDSFEADSIFGGGWRPAGMKQRMVREEIAGLAADALEALAEGATVYEVTYHG